MYTDELAGVVDREFAIAVSNDGPFGLWINALWPSNIGVSFQNKKVIFLRVLLRLLESGRVVLFVPNGVPRQVRSQSGYDVIWAVPPIEMISFIEEHWPAQVIDENDPELNAFWYDPARCPGLGWVDPDTGAIVAS